MSDDLKTEHKNVIAISSAKKKPKKDDEDKLPSVRDLQLNLAMVINRDPLRHIHMPPFPKKFLVIEEADGVRLPLVEGSDGVVKIVSLRAVTNAIVDYTSNLPPEASGYHWQVSQCEHAADFWLASAEPIEPKMVVWRDDDGPAYARLPWPYDEDLAKLPTPLFDELFSRISNGSAVKHWIASLFFKQSYIQQYVWLHGDGGDGKGALARFISQLFGPAACSANPPSRDDRFWTSRLLKKRFVVFPDCNASHFPATGTFKALTGGDQVPIEIKRGAAYSAFLLAKYMFLSNDKPQLSGERADIRRAIFAEVAPLAVGTVFDPDYEKKLWEEGGAFLMKVIKDYRDEYPEHGPIAVDVGAVEDLIQHYEEEFEAVVQGWLSFGTTEQVKAHALAEFIKREFPQTRDRREFEKFLIRRYGIPIGKPQREKSSKTDRSRYYRGVSVRLVKA